MSFLGNRPALERAVWLFLALASALPFLVAPLPILPDLFSHIGRYHVMLHLDDPWLRQYYAFDWHITGNLGADLLMVLLGPLLGTEKAAYLIAGVVPPLMVWGIYRVSKALYGRIEPPAYLAILLVWSFTFHHGFINWWLGMALVFHVVATWIDLRDAPRPLRIAYAFFAALLVWLCHTSAWGVLGILVAAIGFVERKSFVRFVFGMLPWAAPIIPMLVWRVTKGGGLLAEHWWPRVKLSGVRNLLRAEWREFDIICVGIVILAALWLVIDWRFKKNWAFLLAAGALLVLSIALPATVLSSYFADVRLYAPLLMIAFLGVSQMTPGAGRFVLIAGASLFLVRVAETSIGWHQRGTEMEQDLAALNHVPMGARIAVLSHSTECGVWPLAGRNHAASLAIVRRHAFVNTEWDIPGQHLMRPIYNAVYGFNDSRTVDLFNPAYGCPGFRLRRFLRVIPRDRFDYIWMWEAEATLESRKWLNLVYAGPSSRLYAIAKTGDSHSGVELSAPTPK